MREYKQLFEKVVVNTKPLYHLHKFKNFTYYLAINPAVKFFIL